MNEQLAQFFNFKGNYVGMTDDDIRESKELYGANTYTGNDKAVKRYSVKNTLYSGAVIALLVAAVACFVCLDIAMGIAILLIDAIYVAAEIFLMREADKRFFEIRESSAITFRVIRNEKLSFVNKDELLTNDLIVIEAGERVPADAYICESRDFTVDEAVLSNSHTPVTKSVGAETGSSVKNAIVYSGTTVLTGIAICKIFAIGVDTKVYHERGEQPERHPYLSGIEATIRRILPLCYGVAGAIAVLSVLIWTFSVHSAAAGALRAISLGVCFIPTCLCSVIRIYYIKCAGELVNGKAIVRSVNDIEKLNSVNVLCVEKSGALAKNTVEIKQVFTHNEELFYNVAVLATERNTTNPSEKALLNKAVLYDENIYEVCEKNTLLERLADGDENLNGALWDLKETKLYCIKGVPEQVLPLCRIKGDELFKIQNKINEYYSQGHRVIALACTDATEGTTDSTAGFKYTFIGLCSLCEPIRESVSSAVKTCRRVGVRVMMMSDDNASVSAATGKTIGLSGSSVLTKQDIEASRDNNAALNTRADVASKLSLSDKLYMLRTMRENKDVVAVAATRADSTELLENADVAITMSQQTSGVAYEAADILMSNDNFSTIADTIAESRQTYMNVKRAVSSVISAYAALLLIHAENILGKVELMLSPSLVALLTMLVVPAAALMYLGSRCDSAAEIRTSSFVGSRRFNRSFIISTILYSLFAAVSAIVTYLFMYNSANTAFARSCALLSLSWCLAVSGIVRSMNAGAKNVLRLKPIALISLLVMLILPVLLIYIPVVNSAFCLMAIDPLAFAISAATGIVLPLVYFFVGRFIKSHRRSV